MKPLIFITNDDGVNAKGLQYLIEMASNIGDVIAVAPDSAQSGMSSAISVNKPLRINEHESFSNAKVYSISGTPVDCVKLGIDSIVPRKPTILLSGINHGSNSGNAITYSGTMGAVIEGCTLGIPSIGFSLLHHSMKADFSLSAKYVELITRNVLENGLPHNTCLNVNIPAMVEPIGMKVCRAARGHWTQEYKRYLDPIGNPFYWLTGRFVNEEVDAVDTDEYWLSQNYISVVPATPDQTATHAFDFVSSILGL
jgi:5'-nucleotidase